MSKAALTWNRLRYTAYAPFYDTAVRWFQGERRRAIELLSLQGTERILIVGAGTGLDVPLLPPTASVTAIDIAPAMVHRTASRADALGRRIATAVMDAQALSYPDATFDCVLLHLVLSVVPDPYACIHEAARVLRPGGRVSVFDKFLPDQTAPSPLRRAANVVMNAAFFDMNRQLGPLLEAASLTTTYDEAAAFGSLYRIVQAVK
jgi:phosphatidylethanolamine/phosphatidyl-N-methylethanolamine N-methyltransferase